MTARAQVQLQTLADFTVAGAMLTFGAPDEHQAIAPLNGDPATSDTPVNVVVNGKLFVYYGCADKFIGVATANFDQLVNYVLQFPA